MTGWIRSSHQLLLVEPSSMVGSIVVSTARQLDLPAVKLTNSVRQARQELSNKGCNALLVTLDDEGEALAMLRHLRGGGFSCDRAVPVAVVVPQIDATLAEELKLLGVRRVLLKPFKVRDLIATIQNLTDGTSIPRAATH